MSIAILIAALIILGYLLMRMNRKRGPSKYERKPSSPWSALNEGEDPSL